MSSSLRAPTRGRLAKLKQCLTAPAATVSAGAGGDDSDPLGDTQSSSSGGSNCPSAAAGQAPGGCSTTGRSGNRRSSSGGDAATATRSDSWGQATEPQQQQQQHRQGGAPMAAGFSASCEPVPRGADGSGAVKSEAHVCLSTDTVQLDQMRQEALRRNCDTCVAKKVKCDGVWPCNLCTRKGIKCAFSTKRRPGPRPRGATDEVSPSASPVNSGADAQVPKRAQQPQRHMQQPRQATKRHKQVDGKASPASSEQCAVPAFDAFPVGVLPPLDIAASLELGDWPDAPLTLSNDTSAISTSSTRSASSSSASSSGGGGAMAAGGCSTGRMAAAATPSPVTRVALDLPQPQPWQRSPGGAAAQLQRPADAAQREQTSRYHSLMAAFQHPSQQVHQLPPPAATTGGLPAAYPCEPRRRRHSAPAAQAAAVAASGADPLLPPRAPALWPHNYNYAHGSHALEQHLQRQRRELLRMQRRRHPAAPRGGDAPRAVTADQAAEQLRLVVSDPALGAFVTSGGVPPDVFGMEMRAEVVAPEPPNAVLQEVTAMQVPYGSLGAFVQQQRPLTLLGQELQLQQASGDAPAERQQRCNSPDSLAYLDEQLELELALSDGDCDMGADDWDRVCSAASC